MVTKANPRKEKLPQVIKNDDGTVSVRLEEPIAHGDDILIEMLTLKKPKAKHIKHMKMDASVLAIDDMLKLGGKLAMQPPSVMDELGMNDLMAVVGVVEDFLPDTEMAESTGS